MEWNYEGKNPKTQPFAAEEVFQNWMPCADNVELISRHCKGSCDSAWKSVYMLDLPHAQKKFLPALFKDSYLSVTDGCSIRYNTSPTDFQRLQKLLGSLAKLPVLCQMYFNNKCIEFLIKHNGHQ